MVFSDFEFNGQRLSHYNCILSSINNLETTVQMHTPLVLNTFRQSGSKRNKITSISQDDVITATFHIVKTNCQEKDDVVYFLDEEIRSIARWLSCRQYTPLKVYYDDGSFYDAIFYAVCTDMSTVRHGAGIVELVATFTTNAPYGFTEPIIVQRSLSANEQWEVYPDSDEPGKLLPNKVEITLNATPPTATVDGETVRRFLLYNDMDNKYTEVRGCANGERIILDCQNKLIRCERGSTTNPTYRSDMYKNFNFNYPRLYVDRHGTSVAPNTFTANTACYLKITYQNVRKVGVVV